MPRLRFFSFSLACLVLLAGISLVGCSGPFAMFPGGQLDGETQAVPTDWSAAGDHGTCQLETNPSDPYSVNIAYTIVGGVLYVNAGNTETQWVQNMAASPAVRLKLDGALYELRGERVTKASEITAFGKAWTSQSSFYRDPAEMEEVWVYRLVAR